MKISEFNVHWKIINEKNIQEKEQEKIHLIKLDFIEPTEGKIEQTIENFPSTNRFIISNNIKYYNDMLRGKKKYYVQNTSYMDLITFFKRNNKVILNIHNLKNYEYEYVLKSPNDVLRNLECIMMKKNEYAQNWENLLEDWQGNVLLME